MFAKIVYIYIVKPKLFLLLTITLWTLQSCCKLDGKSCDMPSSFGMQPSIIISFKNYPNASFRVITYVQKNNITIDSNIQAVAGDGLFRIWPYKKERGGDIDEVKTRIFIICHNNKSDTISQLNCTYKEEVFNCDTGCGEHYTHGNYSNFTFLYKNQVHSVDSLRIDF